MTAQIQFQSAPAIFALISVVGVLFILLGWNYGVLFKPIGADDRAHKNQFLKQEISRQELVKKLFGDAAYRYYRRVAANREEELWNTLDILGYPPGLRSPADFYLGKFAYATLFFSISAALVTVAILLLGVPPFIVAITLPLTFIGFTLPDLQLKQAIAKRKRQLLYELPETLGELSIHFTSTNSLPQAINNLIEETQNAYGYFYRELVRVRDRYRSGIPLEEALEEMLVRNKDVPLLVRLVQRLIFAQTNGLPILETLNNIAQSAWEEVRNITEATMEVNKRFIVATSFLFVVSVIIYTLVIAALAALTSFQRLFS